MREVVVLIGDPQAQWMQAAFSIFSRQPIPVVCCGDVYTAAGTLGSRLGQFGLLVGSSDCLMADHAHLITMAVHQGWSCWVWSETQVPISLVELLVQYPDQVSLFDDTMALENLEVVGSERVRTDCVASSEEVAALLEEVPYD